MSMMAEPRNSTVCEALVERRRLLDLVDQFLRHRLAGLVVAEVFVDHLVGQEPVLEQLRMEFGVIAHPAAKRGILDRRGQAVQRVPELVEERRCIVERDQQRLARRRLHEVGVVRDAASSPAHRMSNAGR